MALGVVGEGLESYCIMTNVQLKGVLKKKEPEQITMVYVKKKQNLNLPVSILSNFIQIS